MIEHVALGIDIGGTNTAYGLVNRKGEVLFEESVATADYRDPEDLVEKIYQDIKNNSYLDNLLGLGVGAPNGNAFTGNIEFAPNLKWKGVIPIAELFEQKFHRPTLLANDANAAAIGEHLFGNAKDLNDFVLITLGTGLGSGIFINGELIVGSQGFAGEYGHIRVVPNGRSCGCGRKGCLETYVSSTGVVRSVKELESLHKANSSLASLSNVTAKKVFEAANSGDQFACEIVDYTAEMLGISLADFAAFSNPKAYVLFGGLAQSGTYFSEKVKKHMEDNLLQIYQGHIEIRNSVLHDMNAAVLGTAASMFWSAIKK
ncbi:ROK family protein [Fluviicola sp.]|jgi:glucokinase|uniref:ROK family protein n=1 Tax=Fluviicola sp. TaxID=1917219 RepID=UPI00281CDD4E|nr:ROK family protein [Fluviicola sp.]MDR0802952.1 ROK family protein [Fluviicola sp.]